MTNNIRKHPTFSKAEEIKELCRPLRPLNITYFCHVNITNDKKFSAIGNNPEFGEHYLKNRYYNADIHMSDLDYDKYILWDALDKTGESEKMDQEAAEYGLQHTFTITDKNENGNHFYHFSSSIKNSVINQVYLNNLDLLQKFISYFSEKVSHSKTLSSAYGFQFEVDKEQGGFSLNDQGFLQNMQMSRSEAIEQLGLNSIQPAQNERLTLFHKNTNEPLILSIQQSRCLKLLLQGYSSKAIAIKMNISHRTVEHYIENIRKILGCKTSKELIVTYIHLL